MFVTWMQTALEGAMAGLKEARREGFTSATTVVFVFHGAWRTLLARQPTFPLRRFWGAIVLTPLEVAQVMVEEGEERKRQFQAYLTRFAPTPNR